MSEPYTKHFVLPDGASLGSFHNGAKPADNSAIEVPNKKPPGPHKWDFGTGEWIAVALPYDVQRKKEYIEKLGDQGDQNDAIYKGVMAVVDLLKTLGVSDSQLSNAGLLPDKNAAPGTPAHWLGTIDDIKTRNPKPTK